MIVDKFGPAQVGTATMVYADKSVLKNGIATGGFDLSPTPKAYWELAGAVVFGHKRFDNEPTNQVTAHLLYIKEHGQLPDTKVSGRCLIAETMVSLYQVEGPEALRAKAAELLKLDCPNLRQPIPKQIRQVPSVKPRHPARGITL